MQVYKARHDERELYERRFTEESGKLFLKRNTGFENGMMRISVILTITFDAIFQVLNQNKIHIDLYTR